MRNLILLFFVATITSPTLLAQSYGGSAHVHVKDDEGKTRVLVATWPCTRDDEADAKSALKSSLDGQKHYDEDFISGVSYVIDACPDDDDSNYGGSAWAEVRDDEGNTRVLNADWPCTRDSVADAKEALLNSLNGQKHYDEDYVSQVHYDIDSCD